MREALKQKEEEKPTGFDLIVTKRDPRTGRISEINPYDCHIVPGLNGEPRKLYERPVGSGNVFDPNNVPIGRIEKHPKRGVVFKEGEEHIKWIPPETNDQKLAREYTEAKIQNETLKAELAALKAEREKQDRADVNKKQPQKS